LKEAFVFGAAMPELGVQKNRGTQENLASRYVGGNTHTRAQANLVQK